MRLTLAAAMFALLSSLTLPLAAQSILTADGQTDAYTRIRGVLGASPETPDCSHPEFGPHITQAIDDDVKKYVFVFNIHVTPDNDRCTAFDRQRLEIKTDGGSPDYEKGFLNDTVTFRWKFKLPAGFQPSASFTHIHQIKAYDGDASAPIMTLTPRKGTPNRVELIHIDSNGVTTKLANTPLDPFLGRWVEAYEKITYSHNGQYSITLTSLDDGVTLFTYANDNLDLWRTDTTVVRPKWGIYRSLNNKQDLRDEQVRYDRFCLAKGTDDCPSDQTTPEFTLTASSHSAYALPGGTAAFDIATTGLRGFSDGVALSVTGLPPGATADFAPPAIANGSGFSTLTVSVPPDTPAGNYPLVIEGISGVLSHVATPTLSVADFSLALSPASRTVNAGWTEFEIFGGALNGFDEPVHLTVAGLPEGSFGAFTRDTLKSGEMNSRLLVLVPGRVSPGQYPIQVTGAAGPVSHQASATLIVAHEH